MRHSKLCGNDSDSSSSEIPKEDWDAFIYTCFILFFYAALILYFMLKQVCQQDREYNQVVWGQAGGFRQMESVYRKNEREMRSLIKRQLCEHLMKMGQITEGIVETTIENEESPPKIVVEEVTCEKIVSVVPLTTDGNQIENSKCTTSKKSVSFFNDSKMGESSAMVLIPEINHIVVTLND